MRKILWIIVLFVLTGFGTSLQAAPIAHWTFDEGSGTQALDSIGGFNGTLSATGSSWVSGGAAGGALSLSKAAGGLVTMGDVLRLGTGPYSFVFWVKTSTTDTGIAVLTKHWATIPAGYFIGINSNGPYATDTKAWFYNYYIGDEPISTTTVNDDQWHQIIGVRGGGEVKIYVDGLPVESSHPDRGLTNPPQGTPFLIGGYFDGSNPVITYTGLIDDIQVYDHALTENEIDFLFRHPGKTTQDFKTIYLPLILTS